MPNMDRDAAKDMRRRFREGIRDLVESFIQRGEDSHGCSLGFWLGMDNMEEAVDQFIAFLKDKKGTV